MKKNIYFFILSIFFVNFIFIPIFAQDCKKPKMPSKEEWNKWIINIKNVALDSGISEETVNKLNSVKPASKILLRDR